VRKLEHLGGKPMQAHASSYRTHRNPVLTTAPPCCVEITAPERKMLKKKDISPLETQN